MDKLTELAIKYGTDKWGKHHYTPVYYEMFKDRRELVKKVLEIGVAEGAGLRMFRDFFPNATIYGAENDPKRIFSEDRIKVVKCDQTSLDDLIDLTNVTGHDIDLVIDDGSHRTSDQFFTLMTVLPILMEGAIYIIEDVHDPVLVDLIGLTLLDRVDIELVVCGKRYDDSLIIAKYV